MTMNWFHRKLCSSRHWARAVERTLLPWALEDVDLGDRALEIGPGYGANLRVLAERVPTLAAIEIDPELHRKLAAEYGSRVEVIHGDCAPIPLPDDGLDSVVCFTMLHHVPTPALQNAMFAEAMRVLRPGGVFAGSDGVDGVAFRLMHLGDTYNPLPHDTLAARLGAAGFADVAVSLGNRDTQQRFRATKPAPQPS